ncbi:M23 family metallopeptidase [Clostridium septicum]|uniref:M23 family metallopeptidase n=1 Tax=Clostridium septicum TaxID=1504 RepID=A0A9N7PJF1_CLOSE|nr:M23 family metallopeptidase [Clostridium septicum]AYE34751.1 M23 family peptidase [Clostridium septicum]MDU1312742.1 M23 family metallopeptidase [Clostridium septicum]QAS60151.1 M23 family metallopeptidase [Clostridium septicum]UEC20602.1 M23 family metallopeptidase [Clostridium septicum]USS01345.1 M23 family metallopeptidase [Clostridium septicum]
MDQNKKDKVKNFFRKEGFYLVLFLCLCLVATVTVVTSKKNKLKQEQAKQSEKEFTLNVDDKTTSEVQKQNADRVQNNTEEKVAQTENETNQEVATTEKDVNVSAGTNSEVKFINPIEGTISRSYSYPKPQGMKDGTSRNIRGIDVKAKVGTDVKAAAVGEVKEVSKRAEEGNYVLIAHANGVNTKYCNLDSDIKVKVGDKVTEETVIGKVGESSKIFTNSEFGEHINLQVQDSNGKDLDPTKYFTYKAE